MNDKAKTVLTLFSLFLLGGSSAPKEGPRDISELLLLGDSQSVPPHGPGLLLARLLEAFGYKCPVLAVGGKTASYFIKGEGLQKLLAALAKKPRVVIIFLGTNELAGIALDGRMFGPYNKAHAKLREIINKAGARALFVGPPDFRATTKGGGKDPLPIVSAMPVFVPAMQSIYGPDFIDARPLTPDHKGIHFEKSAAELFAKALAPKVVGKL